MVWCSVIFKVNPHVRCIVKEHRGCGARCMGYHQRHTAIQCLVAVRLICKYIQVEEAIRVTSRTSETRMREDQKYEYIVTNGTY
jgi:hypothetical protein